jgi:ABC-type transport system substrate-binding protein
MKPSGLRLVVAAASLLLASGALGATRPHYGGTLRVSTRTTLASLDPADSGPQDSLAGRNLSGLIFDTLVVLDNRGRPQPWLATSWQADPGNQRWQFSLRGGITFQDGTPVSSDAVAASLRVANSKWKVFPTGGSVVIECESSDPSLPAELALPRYGIARRGGGKLIGSGPFAINRWDPGKELTLAARDDYWAGRAFVDAIEVEMGRNFRDQMISLDLNKADLVEVAPEQARRAGLEGRRVESSSPAEWIGLVFARERVSPEDNRLREALAISIDRATISNVLLQGAAEPAGAILPNWMTGYAFFFPVEADLARARQARGEVQQASGWTVSYDAGDALARLIAERVALNARDAGINLQLTSSAAADVRLARIQLASLDGRVALADFAAKVGLPQPKFASESAAGLYAAESAMLQSRQVIPLLHLRTALAMSANLRSWEEGRDGTWRLQNVWLQREKP